MLPLDAAGARGVARDDVAAGAEIDAEAAPGLGEERAAAIQVDAMLVVDLEERALGLAEGADALVAAGLDRTRGRLGLSRRGVVGVVGVVASCDVVVAGR